MDGPRAATALEQVTPPAAKRKRAARACHTCHVRKIRCDAVLQPEGSRCSYCISLGATCEMTAGRQGSKYRKRNTARASSSTAGGRADRGSLFIPWEATPKGRRETRSSSQLRPPPRLVNHSDEYHAPDNPSRLQGLPLSPSITSPTGHAGSDANPRSEPVSEPFTYLSRGNQFSPAHLSPPFQVHPLAASVEPAERPASQASPVTVATTDNVQSADDVWSRPLAQIEGDGGERDGGELDAIPGPSTRSHTTGDVELDPQTQNRIVYTGETFNHAVFPHLTGHRPFPSSGNRQRAQATSESKARPTVTQAIPAPTPPSANWTTKELPGSSEGGNQPNVLSHLAPEDAIYLCRVKNVLTFPSPAVADQFMQVFVTYFLPAYPVIDLNKLQAWYGDFASGVVRSVMLFHAIFFAASQYVDQSVLERAGFESRAEAKVYFYKRVTLLYGMDCEKDPLTIMQSLLFISPWWSYFSEEKETRYWITCVCNLAYSMGLHKTVSPSLNVTVEERSLWRRVFWVVFAREHNTAIGVGRPFLIDVADVDVEPLSEADFYEEGHDQAITDDSVHGVKFSGWSSVHMFFAMELAQISIILEGFIRTASAKVGGKAERLARLLSLRDQLYNRKPNPTIETCSSTYSTVGMAKTAPNDHMWLTFLQLNRERILTLGHRYLHKVLVEEGAISPDAPTVIENREALVRSASRKIHLFDELSSLGLLKYSQGFLNTAIFNALITFGEEIRDAPRDSRRSKVAADKVHTGLVILEDLRDDWGVASWCHSLFSFLSQRNFAVLKKSSRALRAGSPPSSSPWPSREDGQTTRPLNGDDQWPLEDSAYQDIHQWFTEAAFLDPSQNDFFDFQSLMLSGEPFH